MIRSTLLGLAVVLAATAASAALAAPHRAAHADPGPAADASDADAHKILTDGFQPFDQAAQQGWESITPQPVYLTAGIDKPAGTPLVLKPGSYRVVVLCDCNMMEVTLLGPDNTMLPAERSDPRRAMYSFDVPIAGAYLAGIDMDDCGQASCDIGVKVYRKKPD